jgi:hypothetical protein
MCGAGKIIAGGLLRMCIMKMEKSTLTGSELKEAIIAESRLFLLGLETGVSDRTLYGILRRLREKELQLLKLDGSMLDPEMWKIIHSCLANRRVVEIVDTTM